MGEALLDAIAQASGLSPLFAKSNVMRALGRAGLSVHELTQEKLRAALPEIRRGLSPFLDPNQADAAMARITKLCAV